MTAFRPCIDLHQGQVKQIVGGSLTDLGAATNFVSSHNAAYYASLYRQQGLTGGHVIALGPNNQQQVLEALAAYPNGLQFGGGVNLDNATSYLNAGARTLLSPLISSKTAIFPGRGWKKSKPKWVPSIWYWTSAVAAPQRAG